MAIGSVGIGRLVAHLVLDTSRFTSGLASATNSMATAGKAMQRVGRGLTTFVTLPVLAAGAAGLKMSMDFETAFGRMEGLANVPRKALGGMKASVLDLSEATGRLPQEVADALFFVASSGYEAAEAMEVTATSANAARAGMGSTIVIADFLTAAVSAYGRENLTAAAAADTLTEAVVLGKAEADLMAHSLGRVMPIAAQMGVSFDQVAASVAAMSRKMSASNVSVAVVNLRQLLSDLQNPAKGAETVLEKMGIKVRELGQMIREKGLLESLQMLGDKLEASGQDFGDIVGNVRSLTGALELAGVSSQDVEEIFQEMTTSTGMLDRAVAAMANTTGDRGRRALASLARAGIELGNALMPLFIDLVDLVKSAAKWFTSLTTEGQRFVVVAGLLGAALGPALIVLGSLVGILAAISFEVIAVVAAIAALAGGLIYLSENWEAVKERISDWSWWRNMIIDMVQFLIQYNPISLFINMMIKGWNHLVSKMGGVMGQSMQIFDPFEFAIEGLEELKVETKEYEHQFGSFTDAVINFSKKAGKALMDLFPKGIGGGGAAEIIPPATPPQGITGAMGAAFPAGSGKPFTGMADEAAKAKKAVDQLSDAVQHALINAVVDFGETLADVFTGDAGVTGFFNSILVVIADFLSMLGKALIAAGFASEAFRDLFANPVAAIIAGTALIVTAGVVRNLLQKGPGGVQGLATGGYVTSGGVFQLHKDEMVSLPRGSAVTPAHMVNGGGGDLSASIALRRLIIELDDERQRMKR